MVAGYRQGGFGTGRLLLLVIGLVVVVGLIAWLTRVGNREVKPRLEVAVPTADVLPERTPNTPPLPLPTPGG